MPRYVAFLRGINLGRRRLPMTELQRHFEELELAHVDTFIASGNVIFETRARDAGKLESRIENHLVAKLGYTVDTFVRSTTEVTAVLQAEAFPESAPEKGGIHVAFLKKPLPAKIARSLAEYSTATDQLRIIGREIYWRREGGVADANVWNAPAVRALKLPTMTMRNMNSVSKLAEKFGMAVRP